MKYQYFNQNYVSLDKADLFATKNVVVSVNCGKTRMTSGISFTSLCIMFTV